MEYRAAKVGVRSGVHFVVDRHSFCTGGVWSFFSRLGRESVDVIETLSLRILVCCTCAFVKWSAIISWLIDRPCNCNKEYWTSDTI